MVTVLGHIRSKSNILPRPKLKIVLKNEYRPKQIQLKSITQKSIIDCLYELLREVSNYFYLILQTTDIKNVYLKKKKSLLGPQLTLNFTFHFWQTYYNHFFLYFWENTNTFILLCTLKILGLFFC